MTDTGRRVLSYERALRFAVHHFVSHGTVDMATLADEIPVGRATLYRVVGTRDRLVGDVLWVLAERTLDLAERETKSSAASGTERLIAISRSFKEHTLAFEPLRRFLHAEPATAFRVMLTPAGGVSERMVAAWKAMFEKAVADGDIELPFEVDRFAYIFVRIGESMLYSDLLAGLEPDLEAAETVQRLLFRTG